MPSFDKTVLILDGEQKSALAATRSLGRKGVRVIVGSVLKNSLAGASRYCAKNFCYRSPNKDPKAFINDLLAAIVKERVDLLFPMTDLSVFHVLENRAKLEVYTIIPIASNHQYRFASNKIELVRLCRELNIPAPKSRFYSNRSAVNDDYQNLSYPVVLKPQTSLFWYNGKWRKAGVSIIKSPEQLIRTIQSKPSYEHPFMVQDLIEGQGLGIFALFDQGKPIAVFSHRRLREKPPWGGVSVLCESAIPDPVVQNHAIQLLKVLKWHGVAMVEFKQDLKTGIAYIMEINARFWGSLQLSIDAGIDFPYLLYQLSQGLTIPEISNYRYTRLRWLLGDIDHLLIFIRKWLKYDFRIHNLHTTPEAVLKDFLFEFFRNDCQFEIARRNDIAPFIREINNYICHMLRKKN
jgi:predicted ATP-grasp superfamily ATP-dependent carboligase